MRSRIIDERAIRWSPAIEVNKALIVVHFHSLCARLFEDHLVSPRQSPHVCRLVEEGCFVPLIPTRAGDPFVWFIAPESVITFCSSAGISVVVVAPIPPVIVFAAVADRKTPLAG